jgi:hypothetical protein
VDHASDAKESRIADATPFAPLHTATKKVCLPGMRNTPPVLFVVLFAATTAFAQTHVPSIEEMAGRIGFSEQAAERARDGEVVSERLESTSDKDLALAVGARIQAPPQQVYEFVQAERLAEFQTVTLADGRIDPAHPSLADMTLSEATLTKLAADPGGTFHMSEEEAATIREAGRNGTAAALAAYQEVLAARAKAYWEKGLEGITPYAGEGRSPAVDLAHADEAAKALFQHSVLGAEIDVVPARNTGRAEHRLSWALQKGRDQEAPVLIHRILYQGEVGEVFVQRRFYSGYDYDALAIVVGVLPTSDGHSAIFYTNHTYTAQVSGFGGSAKRSIGTKMLEKDVVAEIQRAQETIPGG